MYLQLHRCLFRCLSSKTELHVGKVSNRKGTAAKTKQNQMKRPQQIHNECKNDSLLALDLYLVKFYGYLCRITN